MAKDWIKHKDGLIFRVSTRKNKKYDVFDKDDTYLLSFGGKRPDGTPYAQYFDRLGYYTKFNHMDIQRLRRYYDRFKKTKVGFNPDFFSKQYLW